MGGCETERRKEAEDQEWRTPGREHGDRDDKGKHEGGSSADVGDDAKNPGEHPPEGGVGYAQ